MSVAYSALASGGLTQVGGDFSSCLFFNCLNDMSNVRQILVDTAQNFVVDVLIIVQLHPHFSEARISESVSVEAKLHERMHLFVLGSLHKLTVILDGQLFKAEEGDVCENRIQDDVITVGSDWIDLIELLYEHLEEVLVANATVKDLFNENFLIRVLHTLEEVVSMTINCFDHRVERLDALLALLNQLVELHDKLQL